MYCIMYLYYVSWSKKTNKPELPTHDANMRLIFIPINVSTVVDSFVVIEEHQSIVHNKPGQLFDTRK